MLTNHHCVAGCVQELSTAERDYLKNGFYPSSRSEERQCPGAQAEILDVDRRRDARGQRRDRRQGRADFVRARDGAVAASRSRPARAAKRSIAAR